MLLSFLTNRQEELVGREETISFVWSENPEDTNEWTLDQLIKRVRRKIILLRLPCKTITIKNQGFKITRQFIYFMKKKESLTKKQQLYRAEKILDCYYLLKRDYFNLKNLEKLG